MSLKITKQSGFTIVELLIVLVVTGILAAISIVVYNGIQARALDSSRNNAARQVLTLLEMHKVDHGSYPELPEVWTNMGGACLGEGWPEYNGMQICWNIYDHLLNGTGTYMGSTFWKVDSVDEALSVYGTQPDYPQTPTWRGSHHTGGVMNHNTLAVINNMLDEVAGGGLYKPGYSLVWFLSRDATCDLNGADTEQFAGGEESTVCVVHLD